MQRYQDNKTLIAARSSGGLAVARPGFAARLLTRLGELFEGDTIYWRIPPL